MSLLSKLFGGGKSEPRSAEVVEYEGYRIFPEPAEVGGEYRIAARIELDQDGETKEHNLIRADLIRDRTEAEEASVRKAKQMIDQMGVRLFG